MTPVLSLASLSDDVLFRHVSEALKQYHSLLLLARSPLADSELVFPALVRDNLSATVLERGQALRLVLRWAVRQLEPSPARHGLGSFRPFDDPTWQDPAWWRYNILRHRYIEPLHPDDFVERGRYTETLIALTGIPTRDIYYEERARAIREAVQWMQAQATGGEATHVLRQLALDEAYATIRNDDEARHLLAAAATFADVIPQVLLTSLTRAEGLAEPIDVVNRLVSARYLLAGDDETLWLSPPLRQFFYQREDSQRRRIRHHRIGEYYAAQGDTLRAVFHLQQAGDESAAVALLLDDARDLLYEADGDELAATLGQFNRARISAHQWYRLQVLLADVQRLTGAHDQAVDACRRALKTASTAEEQARVYRRLGKLYEQRSPRQALHYYFEAEERFQRTASDTEFVEMLKDRAWIQIERGEYAAAHKDLQHAQALAPATSQTVRADIHDALASLHYYQEEYAEARHHMRLALGLREVTGDLLGVAKSQTNLGLLFSAMDDHTSAVAAYQEALATYQRLGNRELAAATLLNLGMAYHLMDDRGRAITYYQEALVLCRGHDWAVTAARAHSNLTEAYAEMGQLEAARREWIEGLALARRAGLDDEVAFFAQLVVQFPGLQSADQQVTATAGAPQSDPAPTTENAVKPNLDFEESEALRLARRDGRVTARSLVDAAGVSKATATRKLAALVESARLVKVGQGRNTHYVLPLPAGEEIQPGAVEDVGRVLRQQRVLLEHYYSVCGLALATPTHEASWLDLIADFHELPDLDTFFTLENRLSQALNRSVRLRPVMALSEDEQKVLLAGAGWIWRRT